MNRLFGAFAVLAGVIIIITSGFFINTNTARTVGNLLSLSMEYAEKGDFQNAEISIEKAKNQWENNMETMLLFISHGKLDEIEKTINTACSYIKSREISLYKAECISAHLLIDNFKNVEYPNINNIF